MKGATVAAILIAIPTTAYAQDQGTLPVSFAEVSLGASFVPTIRTKTYTITNGIDTATGHIDLNYGTALTAGAEVGILGGLFPKVGFSLSYDYIQARFDHGLIVGTLNGVPGSIAFNRNDVSSFGLSLDNDVHVVAANIFFSPWESGAIHPYLGVGAGAAIISRADSEFALTATAGVRADISDDVYVGVRYRYHYITGPTDDFGIRYDGINNHSVMAILGVYLDNEPSRPSPMPARSERNVVPPPPPPPLPPPPPPPSAAAREAAPPSSSAEATAPSVAAPLPLPGDLGITGSTVTQYSSVSVNMADPHGAFISGVRSGGAAARAGLMAGDIVITFNGLRVETFDDLTRNVSGTPTGSIVRLVVIRRGHSMDLSVQL